MENGAITSCELKALGFAEFTESRRRILAEMASDGIPANYAALTEASAEALIHAVAVMIEKNNLSLAAADN